MLEKIIKFLIARKVFAFFLMISLFLLGVYSIFKIPRESQPEVNVPIVVVKTPYIGAKSIDVEDIVTNKIEDEINKIKGISSISSTSSDNYSSIIVEFNQNVDIDKKEDEVQKAVNIAKADFSSDIEEPLVQKVEITDEPIYVFSISSDKNDYEFKQKLDNLKEKIEDIDGVGSVEYTGYDEFQYSLYFNPKKAEKYNLSAIDVFNLIKKSNINIPVGKIKIDNINYPIEINTDIKNINELKKIVLINKKDTNIYLSDIVDVKKEFSNNKDFSLTLNKQKDRNPEIKRASVVYIKKEQGYNVQDVVNSVKKFLSEERERYKNKNDDFLDEENIILLNDKGELVKEDLTNLVKNGIMTVLLVFILLLFILGFKDSLIASFGIPFSFVLSFIAFILVGNTLNFISLFSLILSIGILVDSDIVMSEGIEKLIKKGYTKEEASIEAVKRLGTPMIAGTLTTIAVFVPLMFLSGTTGQFIKSIPFTVIFVLIASQLVSIFAIPVLHATNYTNFLKNIKKIFYIGLTSIIFYFLTIIITNLFSNDVINYNILNKNIFIFSIILSLLF